MRRALLVLMLAGVVCWDRPAAAADKPLVVDVWPGKAPGDKGEIAAETMVDSGHVKRVTNVSRPTLTVFKPAKDKDTRAAVVIAPGGGYNILAWDLEGTEVAEWLNSIGVTGIVLKYRVPRRPESPKDAAPPQAEMDAQRALGVVRSKAKEWGIDPKRVGMLGFSAGGHLTAWTSTNFDKRAYEPIDAIDKESCRPDFTVLIYPAYLMNKAKDGLLPDIRVSKETPPTFFVYAENDPVGPENALLMYLALKRQKVSAEIHVYAKGGHGFGLRKSDNPCSTWPQRCTEWMKSQGVLKGAP
jgi:acetyl esterase/lipase